MSRIGLLVIVLMSGSLGRAFTDDARLVGEWKAVTYHIQGTDYPMEGIFIFTPRYFAANVRFRMTNGPIDDANANAGPYKADGKAVVFTQWVQIHLRPGDKKEPIFSRTGADETASYRFEGNRLIITFPSQNWYVLERIPD